MADEDEIDNTLPEPEPEPAPPPAEIKAAQYDYDGQTVMLMIRMLGAAEDTPYALNATDQYGLSPWLRGELERMTGAGEVVIEAAPAIPLEDASA